MSNECLPEENLFTVLLIIQSHLFAMLFFIIFVVLVIVSLLITHKEIYLFILETISLRPSQVVSSHPQGDCSRDHGEAQMCLG